MDDICSNECGIRKNEFIVEFLGEVYPPWRWYERTDRIKYLEKSKGAEQQFDFYNMMLERHNDDENGFNLVFVDPSKKGNYASRISHGCKANCIVTTMATNGKFKIGVFAIRDIKYGEELCFDYNSTTEDEKESKDAICLCGSSICRGSYYYYSGTGAYQDILKIKHHFLHRTASLYKACKEHCDMIENGKNNNNNNNNSNDNSNTNDNSNDNDVVMLNKNDWKWGLTEEEISLFEEHHIGKAVFGENSPKWLITYACEILRYVKLERELLPAELRKQWAEHDWEFEKEWKSERQYKNIRTNYIKSKIQLSKEKEKDNNNNNNSNDNDDSDITMNEIKQYNLTDDEFKEVQQLEEEYLNKKRNERQEEAIQGANDEAVSVQQSRIQTLVITINRILYFFQNESNNRLRNQAPLIILNEYEIINKLWYESMSPIQQFIQCSTLPENHPIIVNIHNFMNTKTPPPSSYANDNSNNNKNDNVITIEESRKLFFWIRDELYKLAPTNTAYHHACADLFHFYGNTKYFFSCNNYSGFTSKPLSYRELGYSKMGNADGKKYGTQYVWGQLSFWERQTIEAPDASLSAQRRGTISLPSIESCYSIVSSHRSNSKSGNKGIGKKYNYKERADLIEWISNENKIGNQWSTKTHWSFRNGKLYGSPWLDYIIDPINEKNKFENCIQFMKTVNVHYPNGVTTSISSNENEDNNNNNNNNRGVGGAGTAASSSSSVSSSNSSRSMSNSNSNSKNGSVDAT